MLEFFSEEKVKHFFTNDFHLSQDAFLKSLANLNNFSVDKKHWTLKNEIDDLSCHAAFIGSKNASKVLVLISGTHGVEGYCGSAIQSFFLTLLNSQALTLNPDVAIVLVHALNPWGMYWARRCDHEGIDVNRNFIDFTVLPKISSDYSKVLDLLNIKKKEVRQEKMQALISLWGQQRFDEVFSGGQYQYDWAPFYGGKEASFSQKVIDDLISAWSLSEKQLVVIDLHTGLGPWSYGEIISDHPEGSLANEYARTLFSEALALTEKGESFSVKKIGLLDYRFHSLMQSKGCFITLEFGTLGTDSLFHCLLNEHLYWRNNQIDSIDDANYQQLRLEMLHHFSPSNTLWQQAVLFKSWQVVQSVLNSFSENK